MANIGTLAAINDVVDAGDVGGVALLWSINVSTAAASAVITVYSGNSTSDPVVDTIDASAAKTCHYYGAEFPNGLFVKLTGGAAKASVSYA